MNNNTKQKITGWLVSIAGVISSLVLFLIFWKKQNKLFSKTEEVIPKIKLPEEPIIETLLSDQPAELTLEENPVDLPADSKDDLKIIEGIGPKISQVLNDHNITTFNALSNTSIEDLKIILSEANIRIADPATWAEQAAYAVKEDWHGLTEYQQVLKGGRRQ